MTRAPEKPRDDVRRPPGRPPLPQPDAFGAPLLRGKELTKKGRPSNGRIKAAKLGQTPDGGWRMYVNPDWLDPDVFYLVALYETYEPKIMSSLDRALAHLKQQLDYHGEVVVQQNELGA